ncbi:hypothetical protein H5410_050608 [Solanum commersonii]|uniref:Uncharacterized protein n=1 Tax=Solanum commersonii TaxID=4109 RepID=A0A9J5WXI8_SOLCO|nr:hypothetical protein H5410_050608 [Solanum commersonii]
MVKTVIPRWFYEWWSYFGGNRDILPQQFLNRFDEFQTKEQISTLPEHIKMCKIFLRKEFLILYLGTWLRLSQTESNISPKRLKFRMDSQDFLFIILINKVMLNYTTYSD